MSETTDLICKVPNKNSSSEFNCNWYPILECLHILIAMVTSFKKAVYTVDVLLTDLECEIQAQVRVSV